MKTYSVPVVPANLRRFDPLYRLGRMENPAAALRTHAIFWSTAFAVMLLKSNPPPGVVFTFTLTISASCPARDNVRRAPPLIRKGG